MKKNYTSVILLFAIIPVFSQNIQLHYDMGKDRGYLTSTIEMFKPDNYGSTFFFIDMDYNVDDIKGISMAYWEIARDLGWWEFPLTFHVEYNGGLGQIATPDVNQAYTINDCWLTGLAYSWNTENFSRGLTLQALYKYIRDKHNMSFQLTGIWYMHFFNNKLSFMGYADFWREEYDFDYDGTADNDFVFQAEPQLWFNFNEHFSAGSEVELAYNFLPFKGFRVYPTIGLKYKF